MAQRAKAPRRQYPVVRLESWDDFLKAMTGTRYAHWAFRGERDARWPLYTTLSRYFQNFGVHPDAWPEQERRILRIFKRKAHVYVDQPPSPDDDFQWLALMQHHGAPTRLLDFTWSPYVAAFFALERTTGDGVVWALNPARIEGSRDPESPIDPRVPGNFARHFLHNQRPFVWLGEPHTMNRRLIAQSATFVLPGMLDMPVEKIVSGREEPEGVVAKFILPQQVREPGMRELYRMNITYATLFPDLDGLARSMGYELEFHWAYNPCTMRRFS
jgi:hypothetical protein